MKYRFAFILFLSAQIAAAQKTETPVDIPEPGSAEAIAKATTEARFLSPWVSYVPASSKVPSPEKFFGRIMGAPGELANSEKSEAYFRALAEASPRVKFFVIGKSEESRDIVMIAIADETGIKNLEQLKNATATLADPRKIDPAAVEKLIASSRPIYYLNAGFR